MVNIDGQRSIAVMEYIIVLNYSKFTQSFDFMVKYICQEVIVVHIKSIGMA